MKNDTKIFIGVGILSLLLVFGSVWFLTRLSQNSSVAEYVDNSVLISDISREKGASANEAKVTIVEFSDFQCPACAGTAPLVDSLVNQYPDEIRFIYRHFPLDSIHRYARLSAYASEAAGNQEKFWEMHDLLFARQSDWSNSSDAKALFISYAEELELDMELFEKDIESEETKNKVNRDFSDGMTAGVNATPTFFINGYSALGFGSPQFNEILQRELEKE